MNKDCDKNIEVEVRALVNEFKGMEERLYNKGAVYKDESYLHDIYFCPVNIFKLEDVEMNEVGSYSLRLRKQLSQGCREEITLNTKTITNHGDHSAWEEHESTVEDFHQMIAILNNIGFKSFFDLKKRRIHYTYNDLEVFFEDIENFGSCVEVEKMVLRGKETETKKRIIEFLESIGISREQIVPKSVTNLVMKKRAFK